MSTNNTKKVLHNGQIFTFDKSVYGSYSLFLEGMSLKRARLNPEYIGVILGRLLNEKFAVEIRCWSNLEKMKRKGRSDMKDIRFCQVIEHRVVYAILTTFWTLTFVYYRKRRDASHWSTEPVRLLR